MNIIIITKLQLILKLSIVDDCEDSFEGEEYYDHPKEEKKYYGGNNYKFVNHMTNFVRDIFSISLGKLVYSFLLKLSSSAFKHFRYLEGEI